MHRVDYKRGGFLMLPCVDEPRTADLVVRYTWYLSAIPVVATLTNVTGSMFALEGIVLNGYALAVAYRFQQDRTNANARKVFLTSLWYLPSLLMLFLLHSKVWDEEEEDNVQQSQLSTYIHAIREKGRELCWHEAVLVSSSSSPNSSSGSDDGSKDHPEKSISVGGAAACPVVVGKETSRHAASSAVAVANAAAAAAEQQPVVTVTAMDLTTATPTEGVKANSSTTKSDS
jgi:hypothetical protein